MSATDTPARPGRHRGPASSLVLPQPPNDDEKHLYIHRNLFFLATTMVIGASTVIISQIDFETHNPLPWPFAVFTVTFFAYQVISLPVNFTGSGFDLAAHELRVRTWNPVWYPTVDIYLPICGEPIPVQHNTWTAVSALAARYEGAARPYVMDDGDDPEAAWSGGLAVAWAALAIWRTVALASAQFAVVLAFGLFNLAMVSRVVIPGEAHRMRSQLVTLLAVLIAAAGLTLTAVRLVAHTSTPAVAHASLSPSLASYLGVYEDGAPPDFAPVGTSPGPSAASRTWWAT